MIFIKKTLLLMAFTITLTVTLSLFVKGETEPLPENVCDDTLPVSIEFTTPLRGEVTSPFSWRINPISGKEEFHRATDIAAEYGTPILSATDAEVIEVTEDAIYGLFVKTEHNSELIARYCHLSGTDLKQGDSIKSGEMIGYVGSSGWATGAHLHFELQYEGIYYDPEKVIDFS